MASTDSDSFAAALQEYYTTENIVDMTYEENPRHALFPKKTDCSGKYYVQPVQYGGTKGRSRSFSTAQSLKDGGEYVDFIVPWRDDYALHSIKRKVMKQSVGDASFFEAQTREFDDILKRLVRSAALSEYRGYGGAMGQINSSYSSGTEITLSDPDEITNFELGDVLQLSAGDGNTSTDTLIAGVERTITAIDVDDGKITFDSATGLAASRYLFKKGDFQKSFNGFLDWCPLTAPSSTAFLGVDRSVHSHLGGNRIDKTGSNIKEAVLAGLTRVRRQGGKTTHVWMNTSVRERLVYELGDAVRYHVTGPQNATVGFEGIRFVGSGNQKPVMAMDDINCPDDVIILENMDTKKLVSLGDVPDVVDDDGVTILRDAVDSGFEMRAEYYANCTEEDTRSNCVVTI